MISSEIRTMIQVEYKGETSRARKLNYAQIDDRRKASKEKLFSGEYTPEDLKTSAMAFLGARS